MRPSGDGVELAGQARADLAVGLEVDQRLGQVVDDACDGGGLVWPAGSSVSGSRSSAKRRAGFGASVAVAVG